MTGTLLNTENKRIKYEVWDLTFFDGSSLVEFQFNINFLLKNFSFLEPDGFGNSQLCIQTASLTFFFFFFDFKSSSEWDWSKVLGVLCHLAIIISMFELFYRNLSFWN